MNGDLSSLAQLLTPEGEPALQKGCNYITIWGYWNGPDELLAAQDDGHHTGDEREVRVRQSI